MSRLRLLLSAAGGLCLWVLALPVVAQCPSGRIYVLEAVPGFGNCIPARTGFGAFFSYVGALYPWLVGTAGGVALLWALLGGIMIMWSGGDSAKQEEGKKKITHAIIGLLIIIFSAMIMNILNPTFYR